MQLNDLGETEQAWHEPGHPRSKARSFLRK
jgi:hypothetical protein